MLTHEKRVIANYDAEGVWVYQAFNPCIVDEAVRLGTFGKRFNLYRMTWIKPSFGWMLHRSGYATSHNQEAIARIKLSHEGFTAILSQGVPTTFNPSLFKSNEAWKASLQKSDVRYQWDPDRDLRGSKLERRAIQIGIRGETVRRYVSEWIVCIEDVTSLAHSIRDAVARRDAVLPAVPVESEYPIPPELARILGE